KYVTLPMDADDYYNQARKVINEGRKGNSTVAEIEQAFMRMRQLSSGFVSFTDENTEERVQYEFPSNPKMDMLMGLVENLQHKAIIFHEFNISSEMISRELTKLGIGHAQLYGKTSKDSTAILHQFD